MACSCPLGHHYHDICHCCGHWPSPCSPACWRSCCSPYCCSGSWAGLCCLAGAGIRYLLPWRRQTVSSFGCWRQVAAVSAYHQPSAGGQRHSLSQGWGAQGSLLQSVAPSWRGERWHPPQQTGRQVLAAVCWHWWGRSSSCLSSPPLSTVHHHLSFLLCLLYGTWEV